MEALLNGLPDLHLWVTSTSRLACPEGLPVTLLTRCLNSPPAVFREAPPAEGVYGKNITTREATNYVCPTDGPPVKYIRYEKSPIPWLAAAHDSRECGQKVGDFLTKILLIAKSGTYYLSSIYLHIYLHIYLSNVSPMSAIYSFAHSFIFRPS